MRYFECNKCSISYVYAGIEIPFTCGAFMGVNIIKGEMIGIGCGGNILEVTQEQANTRIEQLRR